MNGRGGKAHYYHDGSLTPLGKAFEAEAIAKELWGTLDEALEILQRASREAYPARLHDVRDKYRERFEK